MTYRTFSILAKFNEVSSKWIEIVAVDLNDAVADIEAAYGEFEMVTYGCN